MNIRFCQMVIARVIFYLAFSISARLDSAFSAESWAAFSDFFFSQPYYLTKSTMISALVHCLWTHKFHFSATFSLKIGPKALFTLFGLSLFLLKLKTETENTVAKYFLNVWIVPWYPFLMKKLQKSGICGSVNSARMHCSLWKSQHLRLNSDEQ